MLSVRIKIKQHKNSLGFGFLEILVIILVLGLVVLAGLWVIAHQNKTKKEETATQKTIPTANDTSDWKEYHDSTWKFTFSYPNDWSLSSRNSDSFGGTDGKLVTLSSRDLEKEKDGFGVSSITTGAEITISGEKTEMVNFSETGLRANEAYKETTIDGIDAIYYIGRGPSYCYTLIKDKVLYDLCMRTKAYDQKTKEKFMPIFEKIVTSFRISE